MKATQLRIGNITSLGIVFLINQDVFSVIDSKGDWFKNTLTEIKPITLTEEWLIKLGAKKDKIDNTYYLSELEIMLPNFFRYKTSIISRIDYVHQLQNLYFVLTGEELKQQEQCKCGQPKIGGYSCQRTDCNQTFKPE